MIKHLRKKGMTYRETKQRKLYKCVELNRGEEEVRGYWVKSEDIGPILISNN